MMWKSIIAISLGASIGALLRWGLGVKLNGSESIIPLGTLTANLLGAYIIGFFMMFFAHLPHISHEWKLFVITGLCGGLTTFSSFSMEIVTMIQQGKPSASFFSVGSHVIGSIIMVFFGMYSFSFFR